MTRAPALMYNDRMSIREILEKIKALLMTDRFFIAAVLILVLTTSFFLGRLSVTLGGEGHMPVSIQKMALSTSSQVAAVVGAATSTKESEGVAGTTTGAYVGSKKGTKYHLPWCSGAKRITEVNKRWFKDKEEAEKAGYTPAENCPGI